MNTGKYKNKILECFKDEHLLSAEEVGKQISAADFSTIYRNIVSLVEDGILKKIVIDRQNVKYELKKKLDHDHIICENCGLVEAIEIERKDLFQKIKNFSVFDVVFRGRCKDCKLK